jgi:hypothetical protein
VWKGKVGRWIRSAAGLLNAIIGEKFCGVDIYTLQVSLVFSGQRASLNHAFFAVTLKPDTGSAFADFSLNNYQSVIKLTHILTQISRPTKLIRILPTSESCDVRNLPILLEIAVKMSTQRPFFCRKNGRCEPLFLPDRRGSIVIRNTTEEACFDDAR